MRIALLCLVILTGSCSNYEVDTFAKWCEWITDDEALDRHSPLWALRRSIFRVHGTEPLDRAKSGEFDLDANPEFCLFSTASVLFNEIHIHNLKVDDLGRQVGDDVFVYENERMERAKSMPSSILAE